MFLEDVVIKRFLKHIKIDSETGNEKEFYEMLLEELKELGAEVSVDDAGKSNHSNANNIYATFRGNEENEPLVFSCHMDTVKPGKNIETVIENGIIRSKGETILGSDDKSGITALMGSIEEIIKNNENHLTVQFIFTISEENGLNGSKSLDYTKIIGNKCLVLDSSGPIGKIITKAPAQNKITAIIKGRSAHAGLTPEKGISAIMVGTEAISNMKLLRIDEDTTANIGVFEAKGATNIVSENATIVGEIRSLEQYKIEMQTKHMQVCFEEAAHKFGASVNIEVEKMYDAFNIDENDKIVQFVIKHCERIGVKPFVTSSGGGSDANIYNSKGFKSLNLGCGVNNAHSTEEYIEIKDLVDLTKLVYYMIKI
jgi:tripeptide aminopeptidase